MGGDGGVKATQRRFIRGTLNYTEERSETINTKEQRIRRSKYCAQSCTLLKEPIVACELGNLYSKDELINGLLKKTLNEKFEHIRGLKDTRTLILTPNPNASETSEDIPKYSCPVTQHEFNGIIPFICIWTNGWVLSENAIKSIGIERLQSEYGPFTIDDIVKLIPCEDEIEEQFQMLIKRRTCALNEKKASKKRAITHEEDGIEVSIQGKKKKPSTRPLPVNTSRASSVVKVAQEAVERQEEASGVYKGLFHKDKEADKGARDLFAGVAGLRYSVR